MFSNQSTHLQKSQKQTNPLTMHTAKPIENKSIIFYTFLLIR